ncbi:MAG TPA: MFS transporter [Sphingomonas sp.]|nr:MFS transporter [Sphingomonas sp.]
MRRRILILGTVTALGSLATHMIVPVLPAIAADYRVSGGVAQFTLTIYLVALALAQVVSGPIIDRWGRRPLLIAGGALFTGGSLLCWIAPWIGLLLAGRVVQAAGAACGLVAGRAIVGANAQAGGARDMALLTAIVMLSPIFAPVLGSLVAVTAGWQAIFAALTLIGGGATLATARWITDGWTATARRPARLIAGWRGVFADGAFRRHLAIGTAISAGLYAFLASAPFFLTHRFGVPEARLGLMFGAVACGAGGGALLSSVLAARVSPAWLIRLGVLLALVAAALLLLLAISGAGAPPLVAAMAGYAMAGGFVMPNAMMAALAGAEDRVATTVSLYGAVQMAGSGLTTMLVGALAGGDLTITALVILASAATAVLLHLARSRIDVRYNNIIEGRDG